MAGQTTGWPISLKAHFNYNNFGWSEDYWMAGTVGASLQAAQVAARDLLQRRVFWLGLNVVMEYAAVSLVNADQDSLMVDIAGYQGFPQADKIVTALASVDNIDNRGTGLAFRLEATAQSTPVALPKESGTRILRGVPDAWINNVLFQLIPGIQTQVPLVPDPTGALPVINYAGLTGYGNQDVNGNYPVVFTSGSEVTQLFALRQSFLTALVKYCGFLAKLGTTPGTPLSQVTDTQRAAWKVNQYSRMVYRGVSAHRTGRTFADFRGRAKKSY